MDISMFLLELPVMSVKKKIEIRVPREKCLAMNWDGMVGYGVLMPMSSIRHMLLESSMPLESEVSWLSIGTTKTEIYLHYNTVEIICLAFGRSIIPPGKVHYYLQKNFLKSPKILMEAGLITTTINYKGKS